MRKILIIILLIIVIIGCYIFYRITSSTINLKLDEEIGIVFINSNMVLVLSEGNATLLVLKDDKDINALNRFKYDYLTVLLPYNYNVNIKYDKKIILDNEYEIDDVTYSIKNNLIYINYEGINTCIYRGKINNISNCQFIYFYSINVSNVGLSDYNEAIFYHYKYPLPQFFLDSIHRETINSYKIVNDKLTVLKIGENDYDVIAIDNE